MAFDVAIALQPSKYLKEKVYVLDIPEAKSEFALFCRAFHNIWNIYHIRSHDHNQVIRSKLCMLLEDYKNIVITCH